MEESIKKKYIDLIKELKKHNKLYYSNSNPEISDSEFDNLKSSILNLEDKYKYLNHKESPSKIVELPAPSMVRLSVVILTDSSVYVPSPTLIVVLAQPPTLETAYVNVENGEPDEVPALLLDPASST